MVRQFLTVIIFFSIFSAKSAADVAVPLEIDRVNEQLEPKTLSDSLIANAIYLKSLAAQKLTNHSKNVFSLSDVHVAGVEQLSRDEIVNFLELNNEKISFFSWFFPLENLVHKLEEQAWIKSAHIRWFIFPLRLTISIQEEQPWMIARYKGGSWLISNEGVLLESLSQVEDAQKVLEMSSLPRIEGLSFSEDEALRFFSSERERFNYAVKKIKQINKALNKRFEIAVYELLDDGSMKLEPVDFSSYPRLFIRFKKVAQLSDLLDRYFATIDDLRSRNEKVKEIDLRFSQQVIVR